MKVKGLDGRTYQWTPRSTKRKQSLLAGKVKEVIQKLYPLEILYQEVTLPGTGHPSLIADFFLPGLGMLVEVQGRQHQEYVPYFQSHRLNFIKGQDRDRRKKEWCELNEIDLIELYTDDDWGRKLLRADDGAAPLEI
jgi:hypothetical protein